MDEIYINKVGDMINLRNEITEAIGIAAPGTMPQIEYRLLESSKEVGYTRQ